MSTTLNGLASSGKILRKKDTKISINGNYFYCLSLNQFEKTTR